MIHWNVSPEILSLGPLTVRWYGLMFLAGFTLGYRFMVKVCEREGYGPEKLDSLLVHLVLGTVIGARLAHCLFYDPAYYLANPLKILAVWEGGLASHGGGLGVITAIWIFTRKNPEFGLWWLFDRIAIPTVLTGAFIRIGNLMNSEILGLPTKSDWGVIFERVDNVPRHPSMIYESICYFVIAGIVQWLYWNWSKVRPANPAPQVVKGKKKQEALALPPRGFLFGAVLAMIFVARFFIEFFKENQETFNMGFPVNMGQLLSLPFIATGVFFMVRGLRAESAGRAKGAGAS